MEEFGRGGGRFFEIDSTNLGKWVRVRTGIGILREAGEVRNLWEKVSLSNRLSFE